MKLFVIATTDLKEVTARSVPTFLLVYSSLILTVLTFIYLGALAGIVIGSIVFFAIAAGLSGILIFRHQVQKKRRITLTAPDFNLIRFSTVKMPEFPPEMNPDFSDQNIENV
jgi:hypothetical protein